MYCLATIKSQNAIINKKWYDTATATQIGVKYAGEFGDADGYEEQLFVTKSKQHFIYGNGGPDSKYIKPTIELCTDEQAADWLKENKKGEDEVKTAAPKKAGKPPVTKTKEKTKAAPRKYTPEDKAFIADKNNSIELIMEKYGYDKESAHKMRAYFKKRAKAAEDANIE